MSPEPVLAAMRRRLVADYGRLRDRLARRFGSADFASEVLHEAWLHLDRMETSPGAVVNDPGAYLYRTVLNVAADMRRRGARPLTAADVEMFVRSAIDELDPGRIAEARSEVDAVAAAVAALPPRRRAVFIASRLHGLPHKVIAERLGVTVRIVDRELKAALDHLGTVLEKKPAPRRGPRPQKPS